MDSMTEQIDYEERNRQIAEEYCWPGESYASIGKRYGIGGERVRSIVCNQYRLYGSGRGPASLDTVEYGWWGTKTHPGILIEQKPVDSYGVTSRKRVKIVEPENSRSGKPGWQGWRGQFAISKNDAKKLYAYLEHFK